MKSLISSAIAGAFLAVSMPAPAEASTISRACMKSERTGATRSMCRCIQKVANSSLSRSDQKLAASFFEDPHKAQEIRQSDNRSHEKFWLRYKDFGTTVTASCGHLR
ncbi:hypothetical protein BXY66_3819 [Shimia isoporae]|uniref:Uncharacterized protein n=1 Tax=Shimia isoporae TaxID=647720 RepID=A0A4R1N0D6_9RHOB|nr:hypothetical protein [Shimia isoporae]TCK99317.1 hypothetical protein BXY66_3819 [Shimia isoporae]